MADGSREPTTWDFIQAVRQDFREGFSDLRTELHESMAQLRSEIGTTVKTETFAARNAAVDQRFVDVEKDITEMKTLASAADKERHADRRMLLGAVIGAAFSLVVAVVTALLQLGLSAGA